MKKIWLLVLISGIPLLLATTFPDVKRALEQYHGATHNQFIYSGCVPADPGSGLTIATFPCVAFLHDGSTPPRLTRIDQATAPITITDNPVVWLGIYYQRMGQGAASAPAGWTAVSGTYYVFQAAATEPADADGLLKFAKVTVSSPNIDTVTYIGNRDPGTVNPQGFVNVKTHGALGDGTADDRTAICDAVDALVDGSTLYFPPGDYAYTTQTLTIDHSTAGGGAAETYTGICAIKDLDQIKIIMDNARLVENFDPTATGVYQGFIFQNVTNSNFDVNFQGFNTLTDGMTLATNPLDTEGAEVLTFVDGTSNNFVKCNAVAARTCLMVQGYDASSAYFTSNIPHDFQARIFSKDTKYGVRYAGMDGTITDLIAVNNKRSYRLDASGDAQARVIARNDDVYSWDDSSGVFDIYLNSTGASGHAIMKDIQLDVIVENRPDSVIQISNRLGDSAALKNIDLHVVISGGGQIQIANLVDSATAANTIKNLSISGYVNSDSIYPIRLRAQNNASDSTSSLENIFFHDLYITSSAAEIAEFIRTDRSVTTGQHITHLTLQNVVMDGVSARNDEDSDGYLNGALVFKNVDRLTINGVHNNVTGLTAASDTSFACVTCASPAINQLYLPTNATAFTTLTGRTADHQGLAKMLGERIWHPIVDDLNAGVSVTDSSGEPLLRLFDTSGNSQFYASGVGEVFIDDHVLMSETTTPAAPGADKAKLYFKDNGAGKTVLCAIFSSGGEVCSTELIQP